MVSYANGTDPKHFNMTFYDSLGVFKPIFGDFDFLGFLCTPAAPAHAAQYRGGFLKPDGHSGQNFRTWALFDIYLKIFRTCVRFFL